MKRSNPYTFDNIDRRNTTDEPSATGQCCNLPCGVSSSAPATSAMTMPSETAEFFFSPQSAMTKKRAHEILAREMNKMSIEERQQVYDDIHGVRAPVKEDEELLAQKLAEFDREIENHTRRRVNVDATERHRRQRLSSFASAYIKAEEQSKAFVQDRKRRLMFLRADGLNAKDAALRFMKFLEFKLKLFGIEKLTKKITTAEMDDGDMSHLRGGSVQVLPTRDRAGRAVIFGNYHDAIAGDLKHMMRMTVMIVESRMEDEETQRNGVIIVYFCLGKPFVIDANLRRTIWSGGNYLTLLPFRIVGLHMCADDKVMGTIVPLIMLASGSQGRVRCRFHQGTQIECFFALMTFGIPVSLIPITADGKTKTKNHLRWIKQLQEKDSLLESGGDDTEIGLDLLSQNDIIFGRGKPFQDHPGNQRFRFLISTHKEEYQNAGRKRDKIALIDSIVQMVTGNSGRFLEQRTNNKKKTISALWYEVPDSIAREKVSHAFRSRFIAPTTK